ncbi:hypothetical protein Dda_3162 [Drechslerella dactyloides]|uniref:Uncharacterized protein n=1 Tax=Drechslerella dactyloides TaxID=74499 RepID=A0AAD6J2E6_DREDA|nr:hypothetical protein Dda_3162 [Drechslerella dactyloides]
MTINLGDQAHRLGESSQDEWAVPPPVTASSPSSSTGSCTCFDQSALLLDTDRCGIAMPHKAGQPMRHYAM